jgi:hypothetical protein
MVIILIHTISSIYNGVDPNDSNTSSCLTDVGVHYIYYDNNNNNITLTLLVTLLCCLTAEL